MPERTQLVRFSSNLDPQAAADALSRNQAIEWAEPNYYLYPIGNVVAPMRSLPNVLETIGNFDLFDDDSNAGGPRKAGPNPPVQNPPELPGTRITDPRMNETWGIKMVQAPEAWTISPGNRKVVVADIDTGVDYNHEDLINNMWTNPNPTKGDVRGYDFADNDSFPFDDHGHGTHTSGTIGATGGNGIGVSGVSQDVSIMAVRFLGGGYGTTANAILSIDYATQNGARIMSNSWGGGGRSQALEDAVLRAAKADILFVAAAGNDSSDNDVKPSYPAAITHPNMLTVAATTNVDGLSSFSNFGKTTVHVGAPGSQVLSTVVGNQYKAYSGTSMACPHVAGIAALILSVNPKLHATEVKQIIMDSVDQIPALKGITVTGGRVNAKKALERARGLGSFSFDI